MFTSNIIWLFLGSPYVLLFLHVHLRAEKEGQKVRTKLIAQLEARVSFKALFNFRTNGLKIT